MQFREHQQRHAVVSAPILPTREIEQTSLIPPPTYASIGIFPSREAYEIAPLSWIQRLTTSGEGGLALTWLPESANACTAALSIIRHVVFEANPDSRFDLRETRFKLLRLPRFDFDTTSFTKSLRSIPPVSDTPADG